jgi:hypothetical protein
VFTRNINAVSVGNSEARFAAGAVLAGAFNPDGDQVNILLDYPQTAQTSEGWLDYIEVNVRRQLIMNSAGLTFRDLQSLGKPAARYRISGANANLEIWDVTQINAARKQAYTGAGTVEFGAPADSTLRTFVAFYPNASFPKPEKTLGAISNQNLHGLDNLHFAIVYHPEFEAAVQELAEHRRTYSGLAVATVPIGGAAAGAGAETGRGASATAAARSLRSSTVSTTSRFTPSSKPSATPQIGNERRDATARASNIAGCSWRSRAFSDLRSASRMKDILKSMAAMRRNPPFVRASIARSGADRHSPSHRAVR